MGYEIQTGKGLNEKCGKMLTGFSFCLAPTQERQSWLRHGSCVFGGREKKEGKVREKGGKGT